MKTKKTVEQRFWEKVGPHTNSKVCWLWLGASSIGNHSKQRYGHFRIGADVVSAHRLSYEMHYHVTIPTGMTIDHVRARGCTSTLCVNPYHLEVVTGKVNTLRGDGPSAKHAKKTHCPQGHPYNKENTRESYGSRWCRVCDRERHRLKKAAQP